MPTTWKTVRVFISSTFRDMQAERDHLIRFVFPQLRETLLKRRIHLVDVDLRWGVTSEQDALEVCREVITECKPRFLCMLGGRYGWTPEGKDRSITADEVHFAALDQKRENEYHYFYFRDPVATRAMVEKQPGEYREPPGSDNERKLEQLKQEVVAAGYRPTIYSAAWDDKQQRLGKLQKFGEQVYRDLLAGIDDEFGTQPVEQLDEFAEEAGAMDAFIEERVQRYVVGGRQTILDEIDTFAESRDAPSVLVITGAPGSGKSALLGKFFEQYAAAHSQSLVIPHIIGASARSTDLRRTLRRLCRELGHNANAIPQDMNELVEQFADRLDQSSASRPVVLVIDALNQMDTTDNAHRLNWLPRRLPANVRVIISSLAHPVLEVLQSRTEQVRELNLEPLTSADSRAIIQDVLQRFHKRLSDAQIDLLLAKTASSNPLYLLTALEELRTLGDYDEITQHIGDLPDHVRDLICWILKDRLSNDPGFRDDTGNLIGAQLVRQFVSSIGVSRHGLSHRELVGVIDPGDPLGNVAALERLLRPFLMQRGELFDFYHGQFREAVDAEYLDEEHEPLEAHRGLAAYFHGLLNPPDADVWSGDDPRALAELPYHQTHGQSWEDLQATLCNLRFIESKCTASMAYDLMADYYRLDSIRIAKSKALTEYQRFVAAHIHILAISPVLTFQQAANEPSTTAPAQSAESLFVSGGESRPWLRRLNSKSHHCVASLTLVAHSGEITDCCVSANGHRIASCSKDGSLKIWHALSGELMQTIIAPGPVHACALSPDASRVVGIVLNVNDSLICMWDANTGVTLMSSKETSARLTYNATARFSPDGRTFVTSHGGGWEGRLAVFTRGNCSIWDAKDGRHIRSLYDETGGRLLNRLLGVAVFDVAFSPDGRYIVAATWCVPMLPIPIFRLQMWDMESGTEVSAFRCRVRRITRCVWMPQSTTIVASLGDGTMMFIDAESGETIADPVAGGGARKSEFASRLSASPSGGLVFDGSRAVDVSNGRVVGRHPEGVRAYASAWTPDGRSIVCAGDDSRVRILNVDAISSVPGKQHESGIADCVFAPDGLTYLSIGANDNTLRIWDWPTHHEVRSLCVPRARSCAVSPDKRQIALGVEQWSSLLRCRAHLIDWDTGKNVGSMRTNLLPSRGRMREFLVQGLKVSAALGIICFAIEVLDHVPSLAEKPSARQIAFAYGVLGLCFIWFFGGRMWPKVKTSVCQFSPCGQYLVTAEDDGTCRFWSVIERTESEVPLMAPLPKWGTFKIPDNIRQGEALGHFSRQSSDS